MIKTITLTLLSLSLISTPAYSFVDICNEVAVELKQARDEGNLTLTDKQIREVVEQCERVYGG